jgi:retinol dehydrogenase 12
LNEVQLSTALWIVGGVLVLIALKIYFAGGVCKANRDLTGKVIVLTGGSTGLGEQTLRVLATKGCTLIFGARDRQKSEAIAKDLQSRCKCSVLFFPLDLADKKSIEEFAEKVKESCKRIDVLINNAGLICFKRKETKDGFEMTMGVNHLGHFYLTYLLWGHIKLAEQPRVINVSSMGHRGSGLAKEFKTIDFGDFNFEKGFNSSAAYSRSKMANILFTRQLQAKMDAANFNGASCCLHPGVIATDMVRDLGVFAPILKTLLFPITFIFFKTPLQGAQTTLHLTLEEDCNLQKGEYYADCKQQASSQFCSNLDNAAQLWMTSEEILNIQFDI